MCIKTQKMIYWTNCTTTGIFTKKKLLREVTAGHDRSLLCKLLVQSPLSCLKRNYDEIFPDDKAPRSVDVFEDKGLLFCFQHLIKSGWLMFSRSVADVMTMLFYLLTYLGTFTIAV